MYDTVIGQLSLVETYERLLMARTRYHRSTGNVQPRPKAHNEMR